MAQGDPMEFFRAGPRQAREKYYAQVRTEINEILIRWKDACERDDAAAVAKLYAPTASIIPNDSSPRETPDAIREYFTSFLTKVSRVHVRMVGFGTSGDLAYVTDRITYQPTPGGKEMVRTDMLVLRRDGYGAWAIETHILQEEKPAP
jgi:uncharacterized protein (TIGR02246 family)